MMRVKYYNSGSGGKDYSAITFEDYTNEGVLMVTHDRATNSVILNVEQVLDLHTRLTDFVKTLDKPSLPLIEEL